ncbi:hypothetical protein PFISCL1PPCAC_4090, partial [Pristionchus fissidentatus]
DDILKSIFAPVSSSSESEDEEEEVKEEPKDNGLLAFAIQQGIVRQPNPVMLQDQFRKVTLEQAFNGRRDALDRFKQSKQAEFLYDKKELIMDLLIEVEEDLKNVTDLPSFLDFFFELAKRHMRALNNGHFIGISRDLYVMMGMHLGLFRADEDFRSKKLEGFQIRNYHQEAEIYLIDEAQRETDRRTTEKRKLDMDAEEKRAQEEEERLRRENEELDAEVERQTERFRDLLYFDSMRYTTLVFNGYTKFEANEICEKEAHESRLSAEEVVPVLSSPPRSEYDASEADEIDLARLQLDEELGLYNPRAPLPVPPPRPIAPFDVFRAEQERMQRREEASAETAMKQEDVEMEDVSEQSVQPPHHLPPPPVNAAAVAPQPRATPIHKEWERHKKVHGPLSAQLRDRQRDDDDDESERYRDLSGAGYSQEDTYNTVNQATVPQPRHSHRDGQYRGGDEPQTDPGEWNRQRNYWSDSGQSRDKHGVGQSQRGDSGIATPSQYGRREDENERVPTQAAAKSQYGRNDRQSQRGYDNTATAPAQPRYDRNEWEKRRGHSGTNAAVQPRNDRRDKQSQRERQGPSTVVAQPQYNRNELEIRRGRRSPANQAAAQPQLGRGDRESRRGHREERAALQPQPGDLETDGGGEYTDEYGRSILAGFTRRSSRSFAAAAPDAEVDNNADLDTTCEEMEEDEGQRAPSPPPEPVEYVEDERSDNRILAGYKKRLSVREMHALITRAVARERHQLDREIREWRE